MRPLCVCPAPRATGGAAVTASVAAASALLNKRPLLETGTRIPGSRSISMVTEARTDGGMHMVGVQTAEVCRHGKREDETRPSAGVRAATALAEVRSCLSLSCPSLRKARSLTVHRFRAPASHRAAIHVWRWKHMLLGSIEQRWRMLSSSLSEEAERPEQTRRTGLTH